MELIAKLFLTFAKIGLIGFGGGMAILPLIYQSAGSYHRSSFSHVHPGGGMRKISQQISGKQACTGGFCGYKTCSGWNDHGRLFNDRRNIAVFGEFFLLCRRRKLRRFSGSHKACSDRNGCGHVHRGKKIQSQRIDADSNNGCVRCILM